MNLTNANHTAEPWQGSGTTLWAHDGENVYIADFDKSRVISQSAKINNAKRAKLCVNFCAGLPIGMIEDWIKRGIDAQDLIAERDALALKLRDIEERAADERARALEGGE